MELSRENDEEKVMFNLSKGVCSLFGVMFFKLSILGLSVLKIIGSLVLVK